MLYKDNQDVLISVDVFASDRTVRGIIFSLLVNFFSVSFNRTLNIQYQIKLSF